MQHKFFMFAVVMAAFINFQASALWAQTTGTWQLYPAQSTLYATAVQQPINTDGSSNFKANGKAVIPVKFALSTTPGPVVFESIYSNIDPDDDFSFLSFTPSNSIPFKDITNLSAIYSFTEGNCGGGSLRWSIRVSSTQSVFIYYGAYPNFTDCQGVNSQSGVNLITLTDLRYDTSQVGGTFYDDYEGAVSLVGNMPIVRASLVLDSGWVNDQEVTLTSATVNDNIFVPLTGSPMQICTLPAATIQITKLSGSSSGIVNEPESIQPKDDNGVFRIVDCKYMYNLATSSLLGVGRYKVEVVINGSPATGAAEFDLR